MRKNDLQPEQAWGVRKGCNAWVENRILPSRSNGEFSFIFLNECGVVTGIESWNDPAKEKLWLYNLHYFEDLVSVDAESKYTWHQDYINSWINQNLVMTGNGWEPYPSSLRIVNWIKFFLNGAESQRHWLDSLYLQAHVLYQNLEYHLLGNHLLANGKALIFAGLYFEGAFAYKWLKKGLAILNEQLDEQIMPDGAHFELSPMYHCLVLFDLLDVLNLFNEYPIELTKKTYCLCRSKVKLMLRWLSRMIHPDGRISFFNDAAFGIAPEPKVLDLYSQSLGITSSFLAPVVEVRCVKCYSWENSGYLRLEGSGAVVLLDCANVGPDYIPGHAHADTLSFEMSLFDQRLFVNSGTSCYGVSEERLYQRSTAAHNTIEVDGENSSEVWGGFRVAHRAKPQNLQICEDKNGVTVACSHDGYRRLRRDITHRRQWDFATKEMIITDHLSGRFVNAKFRLFFHPHVKVTIDGERTLIATLVNGETVTIVVSGADHISLEESMWYPEFGLAIPNRYLLAEFTDSKLETFISW